MEDSEEEVGEQGVVLTIQSHVAGMFVTAACKNDGQIRVVVIGGVSQVAGVKNTGMVEKRSFSFGTGF